ncbi:hypothetical protein N9Y07_06800 [Alphaproteobacteria bacterium]|nr:hypothetical protein [Alphaproteobacteria bacterium]
MKMYLFSFIGLLLLGLSSIASFNWLMDPIWIFDSPRYSSLNYHKPEFKKNLRLAKAQHVRKSKPLALALGSSISETSMDMNNTLWRVPPNRRYNLGIAGAGIYEQMRYFEHAVTIQKPDVVVLGLSLASFRIRKGPQKDFSHSRLSVDTNGNGQHLYYLRDLAFSLFTLDSIKKSLTTYNSQGKQPNQYDRNGQRNFEFHYVRVKQEGFFKFAMKNLNSIMGKRYEFESPDCKQCTTIKYLRKILDISRNKNIDLKIFINPAHEWYYSALIYSNNWEYYERWLKAVVSEVENEALEYGGTPFEIVDFGRKDQYKTEVIPITNEDKRELLYFWDLTHGRPELGNKVLEVLLSESNNGGDKIGHTVLSSTNVDHHLALKLNEYTDSLQQMTPEEKAIFSGVKQKTSNAFKINTVNTNVLLNKIKKKQQMINQEITNNDRLRGNW